jgi:hypothetical protein
MSPQKNFIATKAAFLLLLTFGGANVWAIDPIGSVAQVNGPLFVQRANGTLKALALHSSVERGDVIVSESSTYARIQFSDESEITLRPSTQLKVESYSFNEIENDGADNIFSVSKGAVQVKTGFAGKYRSGSLKLYVPTALDSSGLVSVKREPGTTFVVEYVPTRESRFMFTGKNQSEPFQSVRMNAKVSASSNFRPQWRSLGMPLPHSSNNFSVSDARKYAVLMSSLVMYGVSRLPGAPHSDMRLDRHGSSSTISTLLTQALRWTVEPLTALPNQMRGMLLAQANVPGSGGGLAPGLYVHVIDGLIQLSNRGGVQQFAAGQFGFTGSVVQPPVIVPKNPGIQFNPPPAFQSSTGPQSTNSGSKSKTVDCEVR